MTNGGDNMGLVTHASHGEVERTRALQGIQHAGTNLPEELIEVEHHIRELITAGYPYLFIEKYLMQHGYAYSMVRKAFYSHTGIKAEDAVNYKWQYSPGNIPGLNMGWGYAKKGGGSYFIMPIGHWYSVFHQVDDLLRQEVSKHPTPQEAVVAAEKLVKKLERWNPPIEDTNAKMDVTQLYNQPTLFMRAAKDSVMNRLKQVFASLSGNVGQLQKLYKELTTIHSSSHQKAVIDQAYSMSMINEGQRTMLLRKFAIDDVRDEAQKENLQHMTDEAEAKPIEDNRPVTPQDHFNRRKLEDVPATNAGDIISAIIIYIQELSAALPDFDLCVDETVFKQTPPSGCADPGGDEPDVTNASAWIAVFLRVIDQTTGITKPGMMVFEVVGNDVTTADTLKGNDDRKYGLSNEGLVDYFSTERSRAAKK